MEGNKSQRIEEEIEEQERQRDEKEKGRRRISSEVTLSDFEEIADALPFGISVFDPARYYLYVNKEFLEENPFGEENPIGHRCQDFICIFRTGDDCDNSPLARVIHTGKPEKHYYAVEKEDGIHPFRVIFIPVVGENGVERVLRITEDLTRTTHIAQELISAFNTLSTIYEVTKYIARETVPEAALKRTLEELRKLIRFDGGGIFTYDEDTGEVMDSVVIGIGERDRGALYRHGGIVIKNLVKDRKEEFFTNEFSEYFHTTPEELAERLSIPVDIIPGSMLYVPLMVQNRILGGTIMGRYGKKGFTEDDLKIAVSLLSHASLSIAHALYIRQIKEGCGQEKRSEERN